MKLLVTDYDGTLNTDIKNLRLNIKAINKFMEAGNKFMIATGRSYNSIKKEIDCFNIKYDYLSCNNGLILFDKKGNILDSSVLSQKDLDFVYDSVMENYSVKKVKLYDFYSSTQYLNDILELFVKFRNVSSAKEYKEYLENLIPHIKCFRTLNKLFISNNISKADSVSFIQKLEDIDLTDIYTVGDSANDIEMLESYNGYKMLYSYPELWFKKPPITSEVHTLVKKINKKGK